MTKLALYEKKYMKKDKARLDYYVEDYIYINNFKIRLGITCIAFFFVTIGMLNKVQHQFVFPTSLWQVIELYLMPYFFPWLIAIIVYSFISTAIYGSQYHKSRQRFIEYRKLLKELDSYGDKQNSDQGEEDEIE